MRDLSIEYRPVASLLPSIRNSRTHSDAQRLLPALRGHMCADGCKFGIHESWQIMIECTFSLGRAWLNARVLMARPAFKPTEEQRRLVEQLAAFGVPVGSMCVMVVDARGGENRDGLARADFEAHPKWRIWRKWSRRW